MRVNSSLNFKSIEISGFRIFDDTGKEIILSKTAKNERNAERNTHTLLFGVTKADIGVRTYTVYAVLSDGSLSADSVKLSFEVRG